MLKILIVDDEKRTREGIIRSIPWASYDITRVEEADDGDTALETAASLSPDIIISDIRMPRMTGIEFTTRIRRLLPACKLIFISGYSDKEYLKSAIQLNAISYVEKPVNIQELKDAIATAVQQCHHENTERLLRNETSIRLEASVPIVRQQLAQYLTEGRVSQDKISEMLALCDLALPAYGNYITVLFRLSPPKDGPGSRTPENAVALLQTIADRLYSDNHIRHLSCIKDTCYLITHILLSPTLSLSQLRACTEEIKRSYCVSAELSGDFQNVLSAGMGLSVSGIHNLNTSYQTSLLAVQKVFFLGNAATVIYDDSAQNPYTYDKTLFDTFDNLLLNGDEPGLQAFTHTIVQDILRHESTLIDHIRALFYKLLLSLYAHSERSGMASDALSEEKELVWKKITDMLTLADLQAYLLSSIRNCFEVAQSRSGINRIAYEIKSYIRKHYGDSGLSISQISGSLNLTPAYLCQVFKKETGSTINDYMNDFRIERSRELLKNRNLKLYEVSEASGYNDVKYFSKTFKRISGMTPSEYREKVLE